MAVPFRIQPRFTCGSQHMLANHPNPTLIFAIVRLWCPELAMFPVAVADGCDGDGLMLRIPFDLVHFWGGLPLLFLTGLGVWIRVASTIAPWRSVASADKPDDCDRFYSSVLTRQSNTPNHAA